MESPSKMNLLSQSLCRPPLLMPRSVYSRHQLPPSPCSPLQWCGVTEGLIVVAVNGAYLTSSFGHTHLDFLSLRASSDLSDPPPLHLTVLRNSSEYVKLRPSPTGLGFHIRGSAPVIIQGVDKGITVITTRVGVDKGNTVIITRVLMVMFQARQLPRLAYCLGRVSCESINRTS